MNAPQLRPPIETRLLSLEALFASGSFAPAPVQRDYQWRRTHCLALLTDLDRVFAASSLALPRDEDQNDAPDAEAPDDHIDPELAINGAAPIEAPIDAYMLGSIVVTRDADHHLQVYDGLQRLTTLTVLMAVLRDSCTEPEAVQRLDAVIRNGKDYRVVLPGRDPTLARQIQAIGMAAKERRAKAPTDMGARIQIAASVFRDGIKPWSEARRNAFVRFLLNHVWVALDEVADPRLARQMFVTLNMRGKNLSRVDLLKGQLVDIAATEEQALQVAGQWNFTRTLCGDQFERFLTSVDFIERRASQGDDCLNALAAHIAATAGPNGIEPWMSKLRNLSEDWVELQRLLTDQPDSAFTSTIWRLQLMKWTQWQPLALYWLADYRRALKQRGAGPAARIKAAERRFDALHRRCMAMTLCGFSASDRERIFARALGQASQNQSPFVSGGALAFTAQHVARIGEVLRGPLTDREIRTPLLRWIESMAYETIVPARVATATIEHILPRRLSEGADWSNDYADPDDRYLACHALGNLAALDRDRNEALRNADFAQKMPTYVAAAADFHTLRDVASATTWTAAGIVERTRRMASDVEAKLALPPPVDRKAGR